MTPCEIEFLLHCHCSGSKHPRQESNAHISAIRCFLDDDLIKHTGGDVYTTTERGDAHVIQLCSLSFPSKAWVNDKGEVIKQ